MKMKTFSERSIKNLQGVHPLLVKLMEEAIKCSPVDFTIIEGVRSTERQKELYAQGRIKPGKIITYVDGIRKKSNHQMKADGYGYAVDLYPYINGSVRVYEGYVPDRLSTIATHIKEIAKKLDISIIWGGEWKIKDYPHFELKL